MLHLLQPTDPQWFSRIEPHLETILVDHTHLEKRAASTALSMIFRYTSRPGLPKALSLVVQEEMDHFSRMIDLLEERDISFIKLDPAPYASNLVRHIHKVEPYTLLDKLLCAALIEARSCERFAILSEAVSDPRLRAFYRELFECEAGHYSVYVHLGVDLFGREEALKRLDELAEAEHQALLASHALPRLHSW